MLGVFYCDNFFPILDVGATAIKLKKKNNVLKI